MIDNNCFEFEVNMSSSEIEDGDCDIWGAAFMWGTDVGLEYNLCIDSGYNCSAIYKMKYDESERNWQTNYSVYFHYEIDFSDNDWEKQLKNTMRDLLIKWSAVDE